MSYLEMAKAAEARLCWEREALGEVLAATSNARDRLWGLLDSWAGTDEAAWTQEAVDRLKDEILDVFRDHPGEAEACFQQWREAHPEARFS